MHLGSLRRGLPCVLLLVALTALSGCHLDGYCIGGCEDDDSGVIDANGDGGQIDASVNDALFDGAPPDACEPFPETCDGADNDCDGTVDEDFDLTQDPAHCGDCSIRCSEPNTAGTCVDSLCHFECLPGYVDLDNDPTNGCNYLCTETNGGVEACDLTDNDCDGNVDEGNDTQNDPDNCGACGTTCFAINSTPTCTLGQCTHGPCDPGTADVNPAIPGCEYTCPVFPPAASETCNGVDEDCDGNVDELPIAGLGGACADPGFEAEMGVGRCTAGVQGCSFGTPTCTGFVRPLADDSICNNVDDDCDGNTDENVDFNDPRHCGSCSPCDLDNAIAGCTAEACTIVDCLPGFVDLDGLPGDGCEYSCTPTGPEQCDGVDNDCNGVVDDNLTAPVGFCDNDGACAGSTVSCSPDLCTGDVGWQCNYGPAAELDSCGHLVLQELECDEMDGDCDGNVDESFSDKGDFCDDSGSGGLPGICRRTGDMQCSADHTQTECVLTSPVVTPQAETCDNRDEDCDGVVDNGAPDDMVPVTNGATTYYIYKYEASRPDATATGDGSASHRSCSKAGVVPWRNVTKVEAAAACAAAGRRLCTESEWQRACAGASALKYPYGNTYSASKCNGRDVDLDCTSPDSDEVSKTGFGYQCPAHGATQCVSPFNAVDMSGNLKEWTSTAVGTGFRVKGGAFDNIAQGLTCDFSFIAFTSDTAFPNLGFRCCGDTP